MIDLTPPDQIDATGTTDVSDALSGWLTSLSPETTVTLPDTAQYRLDYGLRIGSNGHARSHPDLPAVDCPPGLTIRGRGRLFTDRISKNGPDGTIDPRLRNGLPLLLVYRAQALTLDGTLLDHARRAGASYDATREDWAGLRLVGCAGVHATGITVIGAPGDAVAVNAVTVGGNGGDLYQCEDITIADAALRTVGRHAVTLQGVYGFALARTYTWDIPRFLVDAELTANHDAVDVRIADGTGSSGGLGLAQIQAPATSAADRWIIERNTYTRGHLHTVAATVGTRPLDRQRRQFEMRDNTSTDRDPRRGTKPLVFVGHYDDVLVTGNRDRLGRPDRAVRLNACGGTIDVETGNDWSIG